MMCHSVKKTYTHGSCCISLLKFKSFHQFNSLKLPQILDNRDLKQTDAAAAGGEAAVNKQISIQKDSRSSEFSRPSTSITLRLNGDLNRPPPLGRRVSLLKVPVCSVVELCVFTRAEIAAKTSRLICTSKVLPKFSAFKRQNCSLRFHCFLCFG